MAKIIIIYSLKPKTFITFISCQNYMPNKDILLYIYI